MANVKREMNNGNTIIADYQYNPSGTIAGVDYANGTKSSYSYDSRDRVKQIQVLGPDGKMLVKQNMAYDAVGNRSSLFSYNEEEVRYEYDNLNRLTKVNYPKDSEEFKYDASGNRLSLSHAYGKMDYVYDAASNKLEQTNINAHGNIKYTYDGAGNQIKEDWCTGDNLRKSITYKYDPEDRLVGITIAEKLHSGEGTKGSTSEYTYDDSGMRIKKSSLNGTTVYHYDGLDRVIGESDEKGQIKSIHIYANGQRIAEVKTDGNINYFHNDVLGSPVLITDKDAKDIQRYVYEPFGNIVISKGNGENNYIFTGRERDIESNLFYFGARYYNPILGRFISKDVANPKYDDPQTLNRYIYVLNNPIKYYDPDGSYTWPILGLFRITSLYGPRNYLYPGEFHPGIDIAKGMDQPIVSPLSGKVIYSGYLGSLGLTTIIEHRIGLLSFYSMLMHNDALFVVKNQMIKEGQLVSLMGESGLYTNGVHSHYQILTENPFFSDLTKPFYSKENTINPLMFVSLFQDRYSDIGPKEYGLSKTSLMDSFYGPGKSPPNVSLDYPNLNLSIGNNGLGIGFSF